MNVVCGRKCQTVLLPIPFWHQNETHYKGHMERPQLRKLYVLQSKAIQITCIYTFSFL